MEVGLITVEPFKTTHHTLSPYSQFDSGTSRILWDSGPLRHLSRTHIPEFFGPGFGSLVSKDVDPESMRGHLIPTNGFKILSDSLIP